MKNSIKLIAAAVAAASALDASAAQVYSKDETTLDVIGYVDAVYFSGHNNVVDGAEGDSSIGNRTRFGLEGRTKIANGIYGFGKFEHQWQNNGDSSGTNESTRDQYVGVDFGQGGILKAGRFLPNEYKIESVTDLFERNGGYGEEYCNRVSGKINYEISYAGFSAALEYQTAVNNASFGDFDIDVDRGYSAVLGYLSPDVLFGPIGVQLAYGYMKFQEDTIADGNSHRGYDEYDDSAFSLLETDEDLLPYELDHSNYFGASLAWGTYGSGLYLATFYQQSKLEAYSAFTDDDTTVKGSETAVAYTFDNGITLQASYQWKDFSYDNDDEEVDTIIRKVPLMVAWDFNPNFRIWGTDVIDAGSSDDVNDDNLFEIGTRYTF
jgi:predicted porin